MKPLDDPGTEPGDGLGGLKATGNPLRPAGVELRMKTLTSLVLLGLLLPFARPPLCAALDHEAQHDGHEVAHEHMAGSHLVVERDVPPASDTDDCHSLMACNVIIQVTPPPAETRSRATPPTSPQPELRVALPPAPTRGPTAPPPKAL